EDQASLEKRVCALLPVLMLARVDGKSPLEYLSETARQTVRDISIPLIVDPVTRIDSFVGCIAHLLKGETA
ncbi:MAG: hypothetical protein AAFQ15_18320, partial [Pseudomonadota bacterium]